MDLAARELARARRHGRQLTVMYVDLDDLGRINSAHGRAAGDQVIEAVGAALGRSCRPEDFIWHQGEDEFAIVLTETGSNGADIVARRLSMEVLSAAEYVDVTAKISASIGFSTFPGHAEDVTGLFKAPVPRCTWQNPWARAGLRKRSSFNRQKGKKMPVTAAPHPGLRRAEVPQAGYRRAEQTTGTSRKGAQSNICQGRTNRAGYTGEPVASLVIATDSPLLMTGMRQVFRIPPGLKSSAK